MWVLHQQRQRAMKEALPALWQVNFTQPAQAGFFTPGERD